MKIKGIFKDFSGTKIKMFKELYTDIHSACANNRKHKVQKTRQFLAYREYSSTTFFKLSFGYLFKLFCVVCCCEGRTQSKFANFQEFDQFSRDNSHFQGVSSVLEMTLQIPTLFKEFKDLHEPCEKQQL